MFSGYLNQTAYVLYFLCDDVAGRTAEWSRKDCPTKTEILQTADVSWVSSWARDLFVAICCLTTSAKPSIKPIVSSLDI